jgi:hypothetical protein
MVNTYTTQGSVRGCCGHQHKTIKTAQRCINRDHAGCVRQGGYSDRSVVKGDGSELDQDELELLEYLCQ